MKIFIFDDEASVFANLIHDHHEGQIHQDELNVSNPYDYVIILVVQLTDQFFPDESATIDEGKKEES